MLVSPDFGGMKRVKKYANQLNLPMAFLNKERLKPNEVAEITIIGNVEDQDVIIIDDMIDTGNTLLKGCDLLNKSGANSITVMVTHGLFSNDGHKKMVKSIHISKIIITKFNQKFEIIDISTNIVKALNKLI